MALTDKQKASLHKTYTKSFRMAAAATALSLAFSLNAEYNFREGGNWDIHSRITDTHIQNVQTEHPNYTEAQARNLILDRADDFKAEVIKSCRYNTLTMLAMTGIFGYLRKQTKPDNNNKFQP